MPEQPSLKAPTFAKTYGLMMGVGAATLAAGLLIPFVFAGSPKESLTAGPSATATQGTEVTVGNGGAPAAGAVIASAGPRAPSATSPGGGAVTATTGGVGGTTGGTSTTTGGPASAAKNFASDIGITATTIKLGVIVPDSAGSGPSDDAGQPQFGASLGDPALQWKAFIADLNARGGIAGRKIVPVYRKTDTIDQDKMRASCVYLTEQAKVFAVVNSQTFYGDPILCITQQHKTPFIGQAGEGIDFYQKSKGMYFSTTPNKDRVLANLVWEIQRDKALVGHTLGLLDGEGIDTIPVDRTLIPALKRAGIKIAHHSRISSDISTAQSQIPVEVQQMRTAGVDVILPVTNLIIANVFAQEASSQRYTPRYILSDFASGATDFYAAAMPSDFDGLAYTALRTGEVAAGYKEARQDATCRQTYEKQTKTTLDRSSSEYYSTVTACGILDVFAKAAGTVGANLTRTNLSKALQAVGNYDVPYSGAGSFGPGKFDAPDVSRRVVWKASCKCWRPIDAFQRTYY